MLDSILPGLANAANIHPMLVHFPIALWLTALFLHLWGMLRDSYGIRQCGRWLLYLGTLGGLAAVLTGFRAAGQLGHDSPGHDLVHLHRNLMVAATGLALVACICGWIAARRDSRGKQWLLVLLLAALAGLATLGADRGAFMVFGHGVGVRAPEAGQAGPGHEHGHDDD